MKTKFFLGVGLLMSAFGIAQTTAEYPANITDGFHNVHVGNSAGINSTGINNVFIGNLSGQDNISGRRNVMMGAFSGNNNIQGEGNVFSGFESGFNSTIGSSNVFIGFRAGKENVQGTGSVIIGAQAGLNSLNFDTIQGYGANIFIGLDSGKSHIYGTSNTFLGTSTGQKDSICSANTYLGHLAGSNADGNNNVFLGFRTGEFVTGSGNVMLGPKAGQFEIGSNKLYISNSETTNPLIYGEFSSNNPILKFNAKRVGIGFDDSIGGFGSFPNVSGTGTPDVSAYSLFVRGGILTEEIRIRTHNNWPDYVFADNYKLLSLNEVESFIDIHGHLPNIPSAAQVKEEGFEVGDIVKVQQEKIEELTLYLIEQNKQIEELRAQMQILLNKK